MEENINNENEIESPAEIKEENQTESQQEQTEQRKDIVNYEKENIEFNKPPSKDIEEAQDKQGENDHIVDIQEDPKEKSQEEQKEEGNGEPKEEYEKPKEDANEEQKEDVNDEPKEEINEEQKEVVNDEPNKEPNEEPKVEVNNEPKEEINEEQKEQINDEPNKEPNEDPKEEVKEDQKEEVNEDPKEEVNVEPKEEVNVEPKEEVNEDLKEEVNVEPKEEVNAELKEEVNVEPKEEPKEEAKEEQKEEHQEEVNEDPKEEPKEEVKNEEEKEAQIDILNRRQSSSDEDGDNSLKRSNNQIILPEAEQTDFPKPNQEISSERFQEENKEQMMDVQSKKSGSKYDIALNLQQNLENVLLLYKNNLDVLKKINNLMAVYTSFWKLIPHTFEGEITKQSFITLFTKIYKLLLPLFNYKEIDKFVEGQWIFYSKSKSTMEKEAFSKCLFSLAHLWCVHINKDEYEDFLMLIFNRITKKVKIHSKGKKKKVYYPSIRVHIYSPISKEDYDSSTWEYHENESGVHRNLFEIGSDDSEGLKVRPRLGDYYYLNKEYSTILLYDEEVFYTEKEEMDKLDLNEYMITEMLSDDELVIYGYPTQYLINHFKNNPNELNSIVSEETNEYDSQFFITDYKPYEKQKMFLKFENKENFVTFLKANDSFILLRDIFLINQSLSLGNDFAEDELNVINNLRRNISMDRYIQFYSIKLPNGSSIDVNLDNLIIKNTYKKALENIFESNKIGIQSRLWSETIESKLDTIYKTKFALIHIKVLNFNLSYEAFESNIEAIKEEINIKKKQINQEKDIEMAYFDKFKSKNQIVPDNWDSDKDLYDEANKKSPVVLVIGPPLIGKTSVSQKLCKDLDMVYLDPMKYFEAIFAKVAEFEEKMANWDENEGENVENSPGEEEGEEKKDEKEVPKKKKPGLDTALTPLELDVYNDITNGGAVSTLNMQRLYSYLLHSDLALSRGVVIDMNSNIDENEGSFAEKVINGYYGNVVVDYVIDLTINKEELENRRNGIKFNLRQLNYISQRDIELMKKPKIAQKEILEDEIEYDEEGKEIVPEPEPEVELGDEELEKIPKQEDLLEITNFDQISASQYDYYVNVQYPIVKNYVSTLQTNYYIKIDVTGLDSDEVADLAKKKLDFTNPMRPIAKVLDSGDFKALLTDGREGVLPYRRWSPWKQIDPVALRDEFLLLTGSTEFPAVYFSRVFLFVTAENRAKFLDNPKKYISAPPQVPRNYRVSIIGPSKSGKSTIAQMLSDLYGWTVIDMEDIFEKTKEYQKTWAEPELNSIYTRRVHFSASEFKDVLANMAKKPSDRKPDNLVSKIVFMLDSLGIPLEKKKTKEEFFADRKYHADKLKHMFTRMEEKKMRIEEEAEEERLRIQEEENEKMRLEDEVKKEEELFVSFTESARAHWEEAKFRRTEQKNKRLQAVEEAKNAKLKALAEKEAQNPFPNEEDYVIEDLKSDQFYLAFDEEGNHPRVNGIILMNHPFSEEECNKFKDFNIVMDRVIYINDQSDEGLKDYIIRRNPLAANFDEEKQAAETEKIKGEIAKYDEIIAILKEKYNTNGEECVIEVGYNEPMDQLKLKLINALNPFSLKVDQEDKVILPGDIPVDDKYPLSRGPFGLFCPVIYHEDNWLFYGPEANELQVNQKVYRFSGEREMEKFRNNPGLYLGDIPTLYPIDIPPPHIFITGYQGAGVTFFSNVLCKEYRLVKRELQKEFMEIWETQRLARKEIRIAKKKAEIAKQNEEIEERNKQNPESDPEPLVDVEEAIANDAALDEEEEGYNGADNDKEIFKSLFKPLTPSVYDASWNGIEEKIPTPLIDLMTETRRVPNVMIAFKVNMKSIMDRHFHMDKIEEQYEIMLKESNEKRKKREEDLIAQKRQEIYDQLKEKYDAEKENEAEEEKKEKEEKEKEEVEEGEDPGQKEPIEDNGNLIGEEKAEKEENKLPDINTIKVELEPEEKDDIWNSPDPDLIEKETLIQQEKDKLSQRFETNVNAVQTLIETLKERGIPVIEINNDTNKENVYKNLLVELEPYISNRRHLIEKMLVNNKEFPAPLSLRKVRELYTNSEVYLQSVYGLLSPVNPNKLCIRTDYPLVYRDRVYLFNKPEEKKQFCEYPLDYRYGLESPLDSYPMKGRTVIFSIGQMCSGKSTIAKLLENYMGYTRVTVRQACLDVYNKLHSCQLRDEIESIIFNGKATDDNLIIKVLNRRITLDDMINQNIIIDGFPYTLSQASLISVEMKPNYVFVSQCDIKTNLERAFKQKDFKKIPEVINERMKELGDHLKDILNVFKDKNYDIRYFDTEKSLWFIKDQILSLLESRKKYEMKFARSLSKNVPCQLNYLTPKKLIQSIINSEQNRDSCIFYSPVLLRSQHEFSKNKYKNNSTANNIIYTPEGITKFNFLTNEEEVSQFLKDPDNYQDYINTVTCDIHPPKCLKPENIAEILFKDITEVVEANEDEDEGNESDAELKENEDVKLGLNITYEYQNCCPVTIVEDSIMQIGKDTYSVKFNERYYKFVSMERMFKFKKCPLRYTNLAYPVKKTMENNDETEKTINFENTVNFLEFTFGSLITKGMLELSTNRIKYPYLNVKESTLKYLALFLKANNPNNNAYAKKKYGELLKDFVKNSKLPFELLNVFDNYHIEKENPLHKQLIRKQLDNITIKYEELMEKAKVQNNTRFANFFKKDV